ncbi:MULTISPECIES: glycosyltransferase [unclassified Microbacterium]|uniref:glycosyltransferase n=1 Tax=unclassified Microbacterium TaxID=2609290 RepID=UPI00301A2406
MISTPPSGSSRPRMVLVASDVVGARMAGPGIRIVEIARQLADVADVTLAVGTEGSDVAALTAQGLRVAQFRTSAELTALVEAHDIAYCQLVDEAVVRAGMAAGCRFIFDLYNALPAEAVGSERIGGFTTQPEMDDVFRGVLSFFRFCMRAGSYFVTSNERQRDFWLGYMMASDGLLPSELRGRRPADIIGLAPFGMEDAPPLEASALRGTRGISETDTVLLWAGGIWDWFDAETPIRAVAALRQTRPDIHLVFYGTTHPNSLIGKPRTVERAQRLAEELGELDRGVHFIEGWVPAHERSGYLLDADMAVSTHKESFETRFAFRTRILDHFWAHLPSLVSEGDWFAEYIAENDLGEVVPYGDVDATAAAILALSDRTRALEVRSRIDAVRDGWRWEQTVAPLRAVVADWERTLVARPVPAAPPVAAPPAPTLRARLRSVVSRSPLGAVYRRLRHR